MTNSHAPPPLPPRTPHAAPTSSAHGQASPVRLTVDARDRPAPPPLEAWPSYPEEEEAATEPIQRNAYAAAPSFEPAPLRDDPAPDEPGQVETAPTGGRLHTGLIATVGFLAGIAFWHAVGFWTLVHDAVFSGPRFQDAPIYRAERSNTPQLTAPPQRYPSTAISEFDTPADERRALAAPPTKFSPVRITTGSIRRDEPAAPAPQPAQSNPQAAAPAPRPEAIDSPAVNDEINWLPAISTDP